MGVFVLIPGKGASDLPIAGYKRFEYLLSLTTTMKYFVTILLLVLLITPGHAQLTLTYQDFVLSQQNQVSGQTTYSATTQLAPFVTTTGAAQTWDFSNVPWVQDAPATGTQTILQYPGGAVLANDPDFATSTHVIKNVPADPGTPTTYMFMKINTNGWWLLGVTQDSLGIQKKDFSYTPPYQEYAFPLTYLTAWSSTSNFNIAGLPDGFVMTISDDDIADGYGTLVSPNPANSVECLRVKNKITSAFSYMGQGQSSSTYTFSWISKSNKSVVITADKDQVPQAATLASSSSSAVAEAITEDPLQIRISANPVTNRETRLFYTMKTEGNAQVSLMDQLGHEVRLLQNGYAPAGQNFLPIDPTTLSSGTYFLRVNADGVTGIRKLIIAK